MDDYGKGDESSGTPVWVWLLVGGGVLLVVLVVLACAGVGVGFFFLGASPRSAAQLDFVEDIAMEEPADAPQLVEAEPMFDPELVLGVKFNRNNQRFGIFLTKEADPANPDEKKKLTFARQGETNNTCILIDGQENLFGQAPGSWAKDDKAKKIQLKGLEPRPGRKWVDAWQYPEQVRVTQTIMVVPNADTRKLDTLLIHYEIQNRDAIEHHVGLRLMLDTFIGSNDGVPFVIPGRPGLMNTKIDLTEAKDIPDFIQALENPDLANPGTVATMMFRLPPGVRIASDHPWLDPVSRLVICRWPGNPEIRWDFTRPRGVGKEPMFWDMNDKTRGTQNDSCVTVYWNARTMAPNSKRAMAITYGIGKIDTGGLGPDPKKNKLALTYGPKPEPGTEFSVTCWVKDPQPNQQVTLVLPPAGMSFGATPATQAVSAGVAGMSQVSWKVRCAATTRPGPYPLRAQSNGTVATCDVQVKRPADGWPVD